MTLVLALLLAASLQPGDDWRIQLGAEQSEAGAAHDWIAIRNRAQGVLDGLKPKIAPVQVPHKGTLWRLRAGPADPAAAAAICARLKALSIACIVVH
ncbi:MAG TPA: SPOR domain-containing protein [Rhizomicrobium sp.]|nr:SPOR domain-containing protein [Rhizomicrobium sp.]